MSSVKKIGNNDILDFTEDQIALIKSQIAPGCTNDELALFLHVCKKTGLDPLSRQIYAIKRKDRSSEEKKMTIQTSIDGFRVIANRDPAYAGQGKPEFTESTGATVGPLKATVTVYKINKITGERYPAAVGEARWSEFYPGDGPFGFMWKKMPYNQLAKCAEALALRKAFPQDLSGIYTEDEMMQAGPIVPSTENPEKMQKREDNMKLIASKLEHPLLPTDLVEKVRANFDDIRTTIDLQERTIESINRAIAKAEDDANRASES